MTEHRGVGTVMDYFQAGSLLTSRASTLLPVSSGIASSTPITLTNQSGTDSDSAHEQVRLGAKANLSLLLVVAFPVTNACGNQACRSSAIVITPALNGGVYSASTIESPYICERYRESQARIPRSSRWTVHPYRGSVSTRHGRGRDMHFVRYGP